METNLRKDIVSPQIYARIGGVLYLIIIATGFFAVFFVRDKLIEPGDIAATAENIMSSQLKWRIGIVAELIMQICDVPLMLILYLLLKPVNKHLALLTLLFNLIQTAVLVANKLNLVKILFLLGSDNSLKVFEPSQLYTQVYLTLKSYDYGFGMGLIFFGIECIVLGYLIFKSGYLPKTIGVLMQIAGLCYLTNSFGLVISPEFSKMIFPLIMLPVIIAELSFCLWLIIKGVNVNRWYQQVQKSLNQII